MLRQLNMLCKILLIINFITFITCESSYTIYAPGIIQSNRKYTVCATLHNVMESATLRIGIRSNFSWSHTQLLTLQPYETKTLDFYPPKLDMGKQYELFAEGVTGLYFTNSSKIMVGNNEGVNIYIETDKGKYKPGDLLQFRVIILDEHAKPMKIIEPIKVQIFDGSKNRVKQFKDIRLHRGVYADKFQISKEPVLGSWFLKVFIDGKYAVEKRVKFQVDRYVLPKFLVNIETEKYFFVEDRFINIEVSGRYTYNKYVEGAAKLTISEIGGTIDLANFESDIVDFKAKFKIDLENFNEQLLSQKLNVTVSVSEKQTGIVETATTVIYLKKQRYQIVIADEHISFQNEIPYRLKAKILHWNNTAINDRETSVFMKHGDKTYEAKIDDNGMATFEYEFKGNTEYIFRYKNSTEISYNFLPYNYGRTAQKSRCNLKLKNKSPQLNSLIEIIVEIPHNMSSYLVYTVTAHANIIKNDLVHLDKNQNSYTIQLTASNEMVPVSYLYVHYLVADNLIYCEMKIELPEKLENELSISAPKNVKPGDDITMIIEAQPSSHIAIVAVDLSSMLLRDRNKIKNMDIFENMRNDKSYVHRDSPGDPGTLSGLITLTDGHYFSQKMIIGFSGPNKKTFNYNPYNFLDIIANVSPNIIREENLISETIRSYFPETWIFTDLDVTKAVTTINFKVPDTITTWILTGFSINENTGIGILDPFVEITTYKSFFINTYLPYSIKLGEIVSIPVVVFNYHPEGLETEISMENSLNEFTFVDDMTNKTKNSAIEIKNIIVPSNGGKSVNFLICPQKLGDIDVRVKATNKLTSDEVSLKLAVEANGLVKSHNHELYVVLTSEHIFTTYYKINIPPNVVPDSEFLQLSISGNILLPSFNNLDDLIDKPAGCGEQNMIHFAPNILVLEYLSATRQSSKYPDLVAKAKRYTEAGYQQQLKFRHSNGGYSVFGPKRSMTPSNWLTAYVVRFFIKALKYLPIETEIIDSSLQFLANEQLSNGEFINGGYLFQPAHQNRYGFTAFVLLSFLENGKYAKKYKVVVQNALTFLSNNLNQIDDIYSLAIMATTFQMAKHEYASIILDKLKPLAKTENGLQWWEDSMDDRVTDIEITSYILMALLNTPGQYLPIAKWLLEQRNNHGGFKSTQDTVLGLQALIKFEQLNAPQNDTMIKVLFKALSTQNEELEDGVLGLDPDNMNILQIHQLPRSTRSIDIKISGTGNIFLQFFYQYRKSMFETRYEKQVLAKSFAIKTKTNLVNNGLTMNLELCIEYKPLDDVKHLQTNMIIAEIDLPSGYIINGDNIEEIENNDLVSRITNEEPNKIILYFTYMEANEENCINLVADRKDDVRDRKPSMIVVYDYYNSDRREVVTYEIENNELI